VNHFHGLPIDSLSNNQLRLDYLTTAGPRIVRLFLNGESENLLAETPDISWDTPNGVFHLRGGHRLWTAPEDLNRTSAPDNTTLEIQKDQHSIKLHAPPHPATGLSKTIGIRLASDRPAVTLEHQIENHNPFAIELAPWAVTMLPLGGIACLPQPGGSNSPLPNRNLVLWPYMRLHDPRLNLQDDLIVLDGSAADTPFKIGSRNPAGWLCYLCEGKVFVKHSAFQMDATYPDWGCNAELYVWDRFIELETLGPLVELEPGASVFHKETWEVIRVNPALKTVKDMQEIKNIIQSFLGK
jgi:hypothetical protein